MICRIVVTLGLLLAIGSSAKAQEWAREMFNTTEHDFGTVARGAQSEYAFEIENIYEEEVHIASVRSSCHCVSPSIVNDTLKTWEKGSILAVFNTSSFLGQRSATITVTIDKPYYAEVQLTIRGYIRGDVVFQPSVVGFGEVEQGSVSEQKVTVTYAGRSSWQITDVRSASPYYEVELNELERSSNRVSYELLVRLMGDAPSGFINDQLILVTDDQQLSHLPLVVEANVRSSVTVSPGSLSLGVLAPGETVTKQLVVRASRAFRVADIVSDMQMEATPAAEAKELHLVPVTITAPTQEGRFSQTIEIETDLGATAICNVTGTVRASE